MRHLKSEGHRFAVDLASNTAQNEDDENINSEVCIVLVIKILCYSQLNNEAQVKIMCETIGRDGDTKFHFSEAPYLIDML